MIKAAYTTFDYISAVRTPKLIQKRLLMQILSICLTKNDGDILPITIEAALRWSCYIIIIDNGSTDDTRAIATDLAKKYKGVIFFGTVNGEYSNGLRSLAYKRYEHLASKKDWWCRLDSDEFFVEDPRTFLSGVPAYYRSVAGVGLQFYFTEQDHAEYRKHPHAYENGNAVHALKYFNCKASEIRFFRHTGADWGIFDRWPRWRSLLPIYGKIIKFEHYQFRFPGQIQMRLDIRRPIGKLGKEFQHEVRDGWAAHITGGDTQRTSPQRVSPEHWESRLVESSDLYHADDAGSVEEAVKHVRPIPPVWRQFAAHVVKSALNRTSQA